MGDERSWNMVARPKTVNEKGLGYRNDLTGEHAIGDAGQIIFALLFFIIWILDSFFLKLTIQLNDNVPILLRIPVAVILLCLSGYCAWSGLSIVFGEVREKPSVIRKGVFGVIRHPIYVSEMLLYLGVLILSISLAATVVWVVATVFLYYLSYYEERLLLKRFGDEFRDYMADVGMWIPRIRKR
jgi:protein-S-isoprenylcysteine O-methyltransferase Ste14